MDRRDAGREGVRGCEAGRRGSADYNRRPTPRPSGHAPGCRRTPSRSESAPLTAPEPAPSGPKSPSPLLVHAALLGVSVMFGINFVGTKIVLEEVPALPWALLRAVAATAILLPLTPWIAPGARLPGRRTLLLLIPASLLGVGGNQLLFTVGLERTTPAHASVLVTLVPVATLFCAAAVRQERVTGRKLLALTTALLGVLTLLGVDRMVTAPAAADAPDGDGAATLVGDLLTLGGVVSYSIFLVWMRAFARDVAAGVSTAVCFVYSAIFLAACTVPSLSTTDYDGVTNARIWPWAAFAILGSTVATYLLNIWGLRHARSSQVALYIYVQPLVATILSILLGQDAPDLRFYLAALAIGSGVLLGATQARSASDRTAKNRSTER